MTAQRPAMGFITDLQNTLSLKLYRTPLGRACGGLFGPMGANPTW